MKTKAIYLTTTLLLTSSPLVFGDSAATSIHLRYGAPASNASLSVIQDISAGGHDSMAGRVFSLELGLSKQNDTVSITINKAKASYTAHDMTQRLPAAKLVDQSFTLSKVDYGRALQRTDPEKDLEIGVGQIIGADYPVGLALVDILPILPEEAVSVGTTWTSNRDTRSLEGWAWASGSLNSQHIVTAIDQHNGHTIVSATSEAQAQVSSVEGGLQYSGDGDLSRSSQWRFDATDGRMLTVSMQQQTSGINTLPQGEVEVKQLTKVEFATSE